MLESKDNDFGRNSLSEYHENFFQASRYPKPKKENSLPRQCRNNLLRLFFGKISIFQDCFGPKKSFNQIKDIENSIQDIDGVEFGRENKFPLWLSDSSINRYVNFAFALR